MGSTLAPYKVSTFLGNRKVLNLNVKFWKEFEYWKKILLGWPSSQRPKSLFNRAPWLLVSPACRSPIGDHAHSAEGRRADHRRLSRPHVGWSTLSWAWAKQRSPSPISLTPCVCSHPLPLHYATTARCSIHHHRPPP
jgi:hypothetical protein